MQPDSQPDTHSPWYEAFTPHSQPSFDGVRWIGVNSAEGIEASSRPEPLETERPNDALFDCYNG